jgi:branched-chain amino acid transport system ATP-binding protein
VIAGILDRVRRPFDTDGVSAGGGGRLSCHGVDVAYEGVQVLFGVDLEVEAGEMVALLGTNGAGKSTLLRAISGLVDPIAGSIEFDGVDITHADAVRTSRMGIVQLPGGRAVFPTLTVCDHFRAAGWLQRGKSNGVDERVQAAIEKFPRIKERWGQLGGNLSGGEQQQLGLAMAFTANPRLLIIDELSLGLSPIIVEQLLEMVRAINAQGCTVLIVEQSVNTALNLAQRAYFMEKGEVRFSGPTAELLDRKDILRSVFLEGAASVGGKRSSRTSGAPTASAGATARPAEEGAKPALRVEGLRKSFGGIRAVDDVSFQVQPNEIVGLIGPNGAGKTTIFDLISGLLKPDAGSLRLGDRDITRWGPDRRARAGLGRSFQDARVFSSLTVAESLAIGLERHIDTRDHLAALLALPAIQHSEEDVAYAVEDLIELMGLTAFRDKFIGELSTGSRRIVDLAMAIGHDPDVLLLDEPSSGIAQRETEALAPLLRRIQKETGCAMLVIEHDMPLITSVSDRMFALDLGEIIAGGLPAQVINDPKVVSSYLGGEIHAKGAVGA